MPHQFRISVQSLNAGEPAGAALHFDVANHDDLFEIVEKLSRSAPVPAEQVAPLAIGLKLFGEVMMAHRDSPLFAPLWPHIVAFMQRLKARPQGDGESRAG